MAQLSDDDMAQLLQEFLLETREGLDAIEGQLVELEKDPSKREILEAIFRTMHTIKGSGGFLALDKLEGVAHIAEDILTRAMNGQLLLTPASVTVLLSAADALSTILSHLENDGSQGDDDYSELIKKMRAINEAGGRRTTRMTAKIASEDSPLSGLGETWGLFDDDEPSEAPGSEEDKSKDRPTQIIRASDKPSEENKSSEEKSDPDRKQKAAQKSFTPPKVESTIRIDVNLLDKLMNLVGELVLSRNQLLQYGEGVDDSTFNAVLHRTSLVTSELQENVMKARMQPIGTVFAKFPRIVRDLAMTSGKEIELKIEGEGTELDRTIHEGIKDPLVHLIRNACDHGIEMPGDRVKAGKSSKGTILIAAYHEGGQINIDISDNGAGINTEKVKAKALEKGIISQNEAATMSDKEARELIFKAGFSTAEQITNISGRGVGMDVVKTNVEKIGGSIEIESEMGKGSTLRVKIPLTLAIIPALVVRAGNQRFAMPQISLRELVRVEEGSNRKIEEVRGAEVLRLRGKLLPLIRLTTVLGLEPQPLEQGVENVVVVHTGDREIGLLVDAVQDVEEIVVKPLARQLKDLPYFAGSTIMGDGRVALILDVVGLGKSSSFGEGDPEEEAARSEESELAHVASESQSMLLFSLGKNDRFGLPLRLVSRLEKISPEAIEIADGHPVVQYRNSILPLVYAAKFFDVEPASKDEGSMVNVIVFDIDGQSVGVRVNEIIDVIETEAVISDSSGAKPGYLGTAIIQGHATMIIDVFNLLSLENAKLVAGPETMDFTEEAAEDANVLVVDDSQFFRGLISEHLLGARHSVTLMSSAPEALELLQERTFDLIISDIQMPEMNGFQFARQVRKNPETADYIMVACSSLTDPKVPEKAREAGFNYHLVKLDPDQLLSIVNKIMKNKAQETTA